MADLPRYPSPDDDNVIGLERGSTASGSRWVYVFWIIAIALVVLFVVLHLTGAVGPHGH